MARFWASDILGCVDDLPLLLGSCSLAGEESSGLVDLAGAFLGAFAAGFLAALGLLFALVGWAWAASVMASLKSASSSSAVIPTLV